MANALPVRATDVRPCQACRFAHAARVLQAARCHRTDGNIVARAEGNKRLAEQQQERMRATEQRPVAVSAAQERLLAEGRIAAAAASAAAAQARTDATNWSDSIPSYLQTTVESELCGDWSDAIEAAEAEAAAVQRAAREGSDPTAAVNETRALHGATRLAANQRKLWTAIRREAAKDIEQEPILSSFLYASILAHDSFADSLAFVLSNRLSDPTMLPTQLFSLFTSLMESDPSVLEGAVADLQAVYERDPACLSYSCALLYFKGYHAIQIQRLAHALWNQGRKVMALSLQSRLSEVLAVDIHPAARFGWGILLDHGTGVVVGETAVVGSGVSIMQNVTLGGTGKDTGDRHPKIGKNVLIGAGAAILGNITVGVGAQVAAGSLVLKPVEPHTMVAGSPARCVGEVSGNPASDMSQWSVELAYDAQTEDVLVDSEQRRTVVRTRGGDAVPLFLERDYARHADAERALYDSAPSLPSPPQSAEFSGTPPQESGGVSADASAASAAPISASIPVLGSADVRLGDEPSTEAVLSRSSTTTNSASDTTESSSSGGSSRSSGASGPKASSESSSGRNDGSGDDAPALGASEALAREAGAWAAMGAADRGVRSNRRILDRLREAAAAGKADKEGTATNGSIADSADSMDGVEATLSDRVADEQWGVRPAEPDFVI